MLQQWPGPSAGRSTKLGATAAHLAIGSLVAIGSAIGCCSSIARLIASMQGSLVLLQLLFRLDWGGHSLSCTCRRDQPCA